MKSYKKLFSANMLFYIGLFIKVSLGTILASPVLTNLFIPFVNYFVTSGFENPYDKFLNVGQAAHFPYPMLMLYILALPKLLLGMIAPNNPFFTLFLYRIPVILADVYIFLILKHWLKENYCSRLIWFYWMSPVLIYINYIHGQLDVIPIAFLFGSLFYLFRGKSLYSSILLGCALAVKTNTLIILPFFFLFLQSKKLDLKNILLFFCCTFGIFALINIPYITDSAFLEMVFKNQEQYKLFNAFISLNSVAVYLIPASLLSLFVRGILLKNYNRDIFMMFLGFAFSIILLFIPPMQGWYFWLIPFLVYFYVKEEGRSPFLFFSLQAGYLLYFMVIKESDYLSVFYLISKDISSKPSFYDYLNTINLNADISVNFIFTLLQTTLLMNCFWIYKKGLDSYSKHKITASPFLIGIGGNSGVGKTTISDALSMLFTPFNTTVLRGDDMHKWQRGHEKWNEYTHLDPKANYLHKEIDFLKKLKNGRKISRRCYDHTVGQFTSEQVFLPNNIIIFEGLHPFYLLSQRLLYDLKIFIKPSSDLMYHWKIIRDKEKRGYSKEAVINSIKNREKDSKEYIEVQVNKADIVIEILPENKILDVGNAKEKIQVYYQLTLLNDIYIEPLLEALDVVPSLNVEHKYTSDDHQVLVLKGTCPKDKLDKIVYEHIGDLGDLGIDNPQLPEDLFGVLIITLVYYIFEKGEYGRE
jgi:uridine kinase